MPESVTVYVPERGEYITLPCASPLGWRACESCGLGDHMPRPAPPGALCAYCAELRELAAARPERKAVHAPGCEPVTPARCLRIAILILILTVIVLAATGNLA